jgi:putative transcriptional regulator
MKDELFNELLESVRQGGAILRKEKTPGRVFADADVPDAAAVREGYGLSQEKFAALLGISVGTLRNWEQRRRVPEGPARVLLKVAERHPDAVLDTVAGASGRNSHGERTLQRTTRKRSAKRRSG